MCAVATLHPYDAFFSYALVGDIDKAMEHYVEAATSPDRGYVELGPQRVWSRLHLPRSLVERVEQHPDWHTVSTRMETSSTDSSDAVPDVELTACILPAGFV